MSNKGFNRPMGDILHIVDGEAITQPNSPFRAPNSKVILENTEVIGILREPFGPTSRHYQAIRLKNPVNIELIGKSVFAQLINKSKKKRRKYYNKKSKT